jgi:transcriptional regulator GlxA family with amidase domain
MIRIMLRVLTSTKLALLFLAAGAVAQASALQPPEGRKIRVAVVLTEGAVMIDFAGPWEVFENVHIGRGSMDEQMPFELYTVGRDRKPVHTSGGTKPGMTVVPDYGLADAPPPDVVIVGAQSGDDRLGPWLLKVHAQHALIMSVCTGAFRLAETGLLDGKSATTHHASLQRLANQYPRIDVRSAVRYVESDPLILTAGGLSSGIDSALHVVELYYGPQVAQATADYMEYQGRAGSRTPVQANPVTSGRPSRSPTATARRCGGAPSCLLIPSCSRKCR